MNKIYLDLEVCPNCHHTQMWYPNRDCTACGKIIEIDFDDNFWYRGEDQGLLMVKYELPSSGL